MRISSAGLDAGWKTTPLIRPRVYRTATPSTVVTGASNCLTTLSARRRSTAHTAGRVSFIPAAYKRDGAISLTSRVKCTLRYHSCDTDSAEITPRMLTKLFQEASQVLLGGHAPAQRYL